MRADGDDATTRALSAVRDPRVRVLPYEGPLNASAARNRGAQEARGEWIAFLDDDDVWLPEKLERQHRAAAQAGCPEPIVSCRMLVRDGQWERIWPRRLPRTGESAGDYLFRRRTLLGACGFLQTSTLFASRRLFRQVPFSEALQGIEDLDWALRAAREPGVEITFARARDGQPDALAVWNIDSVREHESSRYGWVSQMEWIAASRALLSPEAYASSILTWVSRSAAQQGADRRVFWMLWRESRRGGRPSPLDFGVHLSHWLFSSSRLEQLSGFFSGRRTHQAPNAT